MSGDFVSEKVVGESITFDDVLLLPARSSILPKDADPSGRFSRRVPLRIPISSAAMDTVTEARLAIALALEGGIGVIHRNLPPAAQVRQVDLVKRSANGVIQDPITLREDAKVGEALEIMRENNISGLPVVREGRLSGILTKRDLRFHGGPEIPVREVMTKENLVTAPPETTLDQAREILRRSKVEKLILVDRDRHVRGLITIRDLDRLERFPRAAVDSRGRLRVGAAVGVGDEERVEGLIRAGADVLVVDTAHGHSEGVISTVRRIKKAHDVDVVAGNVATAEATRELLEAGADGIKVGIGPGSICTTRVVAGVGVPQLSAIFACAKAASGVPVIADGGIRLSGDVVKALAAGASCAMIGSLFAGVEESPGEQFLHRGRAFKAVRGMGSLGAMVEGGRERYGQGGVREASKLVPEGIEGMVPYKGPLSAFLHQLVGGVCAGMGYLGARTVGELQEKGRFIRVTPAGARESHPHDVTITREAANYWVAE
ncbi:MAG: IMP dehydrogenase [Planctomycetes bacterium]|nr:IMP dehydrogenase [Planctomycetota bacterium]